MMANSHLINPIPDAVTVVVVQAHIELLAPVADSDVYVFAPAPHEVDFRIRLNPDTPEIRYAVEAELRSIMFREGVLKPSRNNEATSLAAGEQS